MHRQQPHDGERVMSSLTTNQMIALFAAVLDGDETPKLRKPVKRKAKTSA
jgi:hypothetical protein